MSIVLNNRPGRLGLVLGLLLLAVLPALSRPVSAQSSFNVLTNPGFEQGISPITGYPAGWGNWTKHGGTDYSITLNSTDPQEGSYSARLEVGQLVIGFIAIRQGIADTLFSNLTDRPDGLDFWFALDKKYSGIGDFEIRILFGENVGELDYVIDADPILSYPNSTATTADGKDAGVKSILLNSSSFPTVGRWYHFQRNLRSDWEAPLYISNSTFRGFVRGFDPSIPFLEILFVAIAFQSVQTGGYYAEVAWLDNVKLYLNPPSAPPAQRYSLAFNFTDNDNNIVDNKVTWKLLDFTGTGLNYARGSATLQPGPYTIEAYYPAFTQQAPEPYLIYRQTITLNENTTLPPIRLAMVPIQGDYMVFNNDIVSAQILSQDSSRLTFTATGTPGLTYAITLKLSSSPAAIVRESDKVELVKGVDWTYDGAYSRVRITSSELGEFTLYLQPPTRLPTITFVDLQQQSVDTVISFQLSNSNNAPITYLPEKITPDENFPYRVQASYKDYLFYTNTLDFSKTTPIQLQMTSLDNTRTSFVLVNSTATSIDFGVTEHSLSRITLRVEGSGPTLIIMDSATKPLRVERNGARIASWTYNSTSHVATVESDQPGTFTVVLEENRTDYTTYLVAGGAALAASIVAVLGLIWKRKNSRINTALSNLTDRTVPL